MGTWKGLKEDGVGGGGLSCLVGLDCELGRTKNGSNSSMHRPLADWYGRLGHLP